MRSRGKEPVGNYNPLSIGELFWELSSKWEHFAADHVDQVSEMCTMFTNTLLEEACPRDGRNLTLPIVCWSPLLHPLLWRVNQATASSTQP